MSEIAILEAKRVPVDEIAESPFNPRKVYDGKYLEELAGSIKTRGLMSPVLLRKVADKKKPYEIVFGHCRFRATKLAGVDTVRAEICQLSDRDALEFQIEENWKRRDPSPIEEAEAFSLLHFQHHVAVTEIAERLSRSADHVSRRLQLCHLPKDAMEAVQAGTLALEVALALARLAPSGRAGEASKKILAGSNEWEQHVDDETGERRYGQVKRPFTTKEALALIRREFNLRLDDHCGFDLGDAYLLHGVGPCLTCPKSSLANRTLFPDLAAKDNVCTDSKCFESKREAGWKVKKAALEAEGRKVLDGKEAAKVISEFGRPKTGYVDPGQHIYEDPKGRTAAQIIGKKALDELKVTARADDGKMYEVLPEAKVKDALKAKLKEAGLKPAVTSRSQPAAPSAAEKAARKKRELELQAQTMALSLAAGELAGQVAVDDRPEVLWHVLAELLLDAADASVDLDTALYLRRRGLLDGTDATYTAEQKALEKLKKDLKSMTVSQARGLTLEVALQLGGCFDHFDSRGAKHLAKVCEAFGLKFKDFERDAKKKLETAADADEPKAKAKGGGKR